MRRRKKKKAPMPWREGILDHHKPRPTTAERNDFPRNVVEMAKRKSRGICQECYTRPCQTTHHVMPRSLGGRGVYENAYRCCGACHILIERSEARKQEIIEHHKKLFGDFFWYDEKDWQEKRMRDAVRSV